MESNEVYEENQEGVSLKLCHLHNQQNTQVALEASR
jgi:hypothetical protein